MKVIITGSLGNIGKPLTRALLENGHYVTVVSSKPGNQSEIEILGATAAIGLLEDTGFLAATLTGADAVFAMVPPNFMVPDSREYYIRMGNGYAQAIQQSGIKRVIHLSSYGAHLDKGTGFILGSHEVELILNKLQDVAITHMRAAYFYTNLFNFADMIKGAGFIGANFGGDDRIVMVHPADIATAVADEIDMPVTGKKIRYVASEEVIASKAARVLGAAIGKPDLKWLTLTDDQMKDGMEKRGIPAHIVANFVELGAGIHSGILLEDYDEHKPAEMGTVKMEDFAREFAAAYLKK